MRPAIAVLHARPGPAALHDEAVTGEALLHYTTLMLGRPGFNHPPRAIHTSVIASPALHRGALDCATPGAQPGACSLVLTNTWARRSSHEIAKRAPPTRTACQTVFALFPHRDHWGVRGSPHRRRMLQGQQQRIGTHHQPGGLGAGGGRRRAHLPRDRPELHLPRHAVERAG